MQQYVEMTALRAVRARAFFGFLPSERRGLLKTKGRYFEADLPPVTLCFLPVKPMPREFAGAKQPRIRTDLPLTLNVTIGTSHLTV